MRQLILLFLVLDLFSILLLCNALKALLKLLQVNLIKFVYFWFANLNFPKSLKSLHAHPIIIHIITGASAGFSYSSLFISAEMSFDQVIKDIQA